MRVYGIIGHPLGHSLSPIMHNAAFSAVGMDAVYVPLEVEPAQLKRAVLGLGPLGFAGVNVTIPFKEQVVPFLTTIDERSKGIGAVNTIVVQQDKLLGYNTDGRGFVADLEHFGQLRAKSLSVCLLGAGGSARAIAWELAKSGAVRIVIANRTIGRAKGLAADLKGQFPRCAFEAISLTKPDTTAAIASSQLLINATSVGMRKADPLLIDPEALHRGLVVYDIVYQPPVTKLLEAAKNQGLLATGGLGMLVRQGALAFELWTKREAPVEVMRRSVEQALQRQAVAARQEATASS